MPFNPTGGPHVALCDPGQEDFNLNFIYSSNCMMQISLLEPCTALLDGWSFRIF
jgi:hypothetical protein